MKILFVAKNIPLPGHKENNIILKQASVLRREGHEVDIIYPKELLPGFILTENSRLKSNKSLGKEFYMDGHSINTISFFRFPCKKYEWFFVDKALRLMNYGLLKELKLKEYDLIHAHYFFPDSIIAIELAKLLKVPCVTTFRNGDLNNIGYCSNKKILKDKIKHISSFIFPSHSLRYSFLKYINFLESTTVINNFIDSEYFSEKRFFSKERSKKVVIIANGIPRKNIDWVVEYGVVNHKVIIDVIGEGPVINYLESKNKCSNVFFKGRMDKYEISTILDSSIVMALPSQGETFGLVYAEALSRGNIIIGMKNNGLSGMNIDSSFFVNSKEELFTTLDEIFSKDDYQLDDLIDYSYKISNIFHEDVFVHELSELYKKVIDKNKQGLN